MSFEEDSMNLLKKISIVFYNFLFLATLQAMNGPFITLTNVTSYRVYVESEIMHPLYGIKVIRVCEIPSSDMRLSLKSPNIFFKANKMWIRLIVLDYPKKGNIQRLEFEPVDKLVGFVKQSSKTGKVVLSETKD